MKITGPGPLRSTPARQARPGNGKAKSGFARALGDKPSEPGRLTGTAPVGAVEALLALQEVRDSAQGRGRLVARGYDLLRRLEEIRLSLLAGAIPRDRLHELLAAVRARRGQVDDPELAALIDEIELRASVELAKFGLFP